MSNIFFWIFPSLLKYLPSKNCSLHFWGVAGAICITWQFVGQNWVRYDLSKFNTFDLYFQLIYIALVIDHPLLNHWQFCKLHIYVWGSILMSDVIGVWCMVYICMSFSKDPDKSRLLYLLFPKKKTSSFSLAHLGDIEYVSHM